MGTELGTEVRPRFGVVAVRRAARDASFSFVPLPPATRCFKEPLSLPFHFQFAHPPHPRFPYPRSESTACFCPSTAHRPTRVIFHNTWLQGVNHHNIQTDAHASASTLLPRRTASLTGGSAARAKTIPVAIAFIPVLLCAY